MLRFPMTREALPEKMGGKMRRTPVFLKRGLQAGMGEGVIEKDCRPSARGETSLLYELPDQATIPV